MIQMSHEPLLLSNPAKMNDPTTTNMSSMVIVTSCSETSTHSPIAVLKTPSWVRRPTSTPDVTRMATMPGTRPILRSLWKLPLISVNLQYLGGNSTYVRSEERRVGKDCKFE